MNLLSAPYLKYFETVRLMSRVTLVTLIACMPWASLSSATSPPGQWAGVVMFSGIRWLGWLWGPRLRLEKIEKMIVEKGLNRPFFCFKEPGI